MRIAIDCRMMNSSGIGTFLMGILLEILPNTQLEFLLIGDMNKIITSLNLQNKNLNIRYLNFKAPIFSIKELLCFPTKIVNQYDCYFTPNYNIPFGIKIPVISTIHDVLFLDQPQIAGILGTRLRKLWISFAIKQSDKILTVSNFSKERIIAHFPHANQVIVCGNGIKESIKEFRFTIQEKSHPDGYFLYVGNLKPHKGLDILLNAYKKYRENGGQNRLKIVGEYRNFRTKLDLNFDNLDSYHIDFTGPLSEISLINTIKGAECLIQPSFYEGFGIPPLEAMYLGTPVILSDIQVFKELYSDFPVTFFKTGDSNELQLTLFEKRHKVKLTETQLNKYSYHKVAITLLDIINTL